MPISRMNFVDVGPPEALFKRILQAEPNLSMPVPIQTLCASLGIHQIEHLDTNGFECGLVTNAKRTEGNILDSRYGSRVPSRGKRGAELHSPRNASLK